MAIPSENADLYRRLKLYGLGFLMGIILLSFMLKGKGCQMPGSRKLDELSYQKLEYTIHGACRMKCKNISEAEVKALLKSGEINYDKSDVRAKPFGTYAVEGNTSDGQNVRLVIADCDTISKLVTAIDLRSEKDSCDCR